MRFSTALLFATTLLVASASRFTPKYTHIPEVKAYYDYLLAHEEEILASQPDFFDVFDVATGWAATQLCSAIFVSGIDEETAIIEDVSAARYVTELKVDYDERSVIATTNGEFLQKAIFRDGLGCTLVAGMSEEELRDQDVGDQTPLPALNATLEWPLGDYVDFDNIPPEVNMNCIERVVAQDFLNPVYNTRATLLVYKGKIIFERYKDGITKNSKLIGWSMSKSVTATLTGMLVDQGRLDIDDPAAVPEWSGDERSNITVRNLLYMGSGLQYNEGMVVMCLFTSGGDCSGWYADRPQGKYGPGEDFNYSTGSTTLLSRINTQNRVQDSTNFEYYRRALYSKIQMHESLIESQAIDGIPLGGSNMFATARDWARFGHMHMLDGLWEDGTRILSKAWVDYTCTSSPVYGGYGAQWWIATYGGEGVCRMDGFRNQNVFNIRSKDLSIVRLSMPGLIMGGLWSKSDYVAELLQCFP